MEINGDYKFKATQDKVWKTLMDKDAMQKAMPGCESFEQVGEQAYEVTMKVGVAAVKGTYNGKISITETIEPTQYVLRVEGANGQGFLHGEGTFNLNQEGEENELRTIVTYKGVANVGGTLAGIGARMLQPVAKLLVGNFFKSMEKQLNGQEGDSTEIEKSIAI